MSDFDDDDFGNFEGADVSTSPLPPPETKTVLSWIMQNSPTTSGTTEVDGNQELPKDQNFFADAEISTDAPTDAEHEHTKEEEEQVRDSAPAVDDSVIMAKNMEIEELKTNLSMLTLQKEQSQEEFMGKIQKLKEDLKLQEEKAAEEKVEMKDEIKCLKKKHEDDILALHEISSNTVEMISKQNAELWEKYEKSYGKKLHEDANKIVEHCFEMMEKQNKLLQDEINEEIAKAKENMNNELKAKSTIISEEAKSLMKDEKENLQEKLTAFVKEEAVNEMELMRKSNEKLLKESLTKQHDNFQLQLRETIKEENEKFNRVLDEMIKSTMEQVKSQMEEEQKAQDEMNKRKTLAAKMFLTAAMKQVDGMFNSEDNDSTE